MRQMKETHGNLVGIIGFIINKGEEEMKILKNRLIPAIFFSVWTIIFGILAIMQIGNVAGPILTGIAAIFFWISFILEQIEKKIRGNK